MPKSPHPTSLPRHGTPRLAQAPALGFLAVALDRPGGPVLHHELLEGCNRRLGIAPIRDAAEADLHALTIEVDGDVTAVATFKIAHVGVLGQELGDQTVGRRVQVMDVPTNSVARVGEPAMLKSALRSVAQKEWMSPPITTGLARRLAAMASRRRWRAAG